VTRGEVFTIYMMDSRTRPQKIFERSGLLKAIT